MLRFPGNRWCHGLARLGSRAGKLSSFDGLSVGEVLAAAKFPNLETTTAVATSQVTMTTTSAMVATTIAPPLACEDDADCKFIDFRIGCDKKVIGDKTLADLCPKTCAACSP